MKKQVLGNKCKRLIDYGRLKYLESVGFKTKMI